MNIKGTQCGYYMLLYVPAHFSASHLKSTVPYQCFPQTRGNTSTSKVPEFFKRTKLKQGYRKAFIKYYHALHSQQCHRTVAPDGHDLSNPFKKVPDLHTTIHAQTFQPGKLCTWDVSRVLRRYHSYIINSQIYMRRRCFAMYKRHGWKKRGCIKCSSDAMC